MSRKQVIGYRTEPTESSRGPSTAAYYLATRTDVVQFYLFDEPPADGSGAWTLIDAFDRLRLQGAADKATAKVWVKRLGLTSWTYVKVGA